jgi:Histidine kinase-, DNA gyrase B-, and HSP90-like ATPase
MQKPLEVDGINLVTALDPSLSSILGDASTLQQVLLNLVTNAREAMTSGGEIRIETGPAERADWVRVTVADTGPGISPEDLSKVFDPFYTTKRTGTGPVRELRHHPGPSRHRRRAIHTRARDHVRSRLPGSAGRGGLRSRRRRCGANSWKPRPVA